MMTNHMASASTLRELKTLSIMLTYRCTAECKDCGTFSSPRDQHAVPLPVVLGAIREARSLGFGNVVFTGGEATLRWGDLLEGIRCARSHGFPARLVTNGHWAAVEHDACALVAELIGAGLDEINFSTGTEHLRFISAETLARACVATLSAGMRTTLMFELHGEGVTQRKDIEAKIRAMVSADRYAKLFSVIESPWMPVKWHRPSGTAPETLTNLANVHTRPGCDSILQTYVVQGDAKLAACCGLGMRGIRELHVGSALQPAFLRRGVEAAEDDWLKMALRFLGPEKILAWAASIDPTIEWENLYAHRCHACIRLYQDDDVRGVIRDHFDALKPEIVATAYIDSQLVPQMAAAATV
jgi:hypothetical protein